MYFLLTIVGLVTAFFAWVVVVPWLTELLEDKDTVPDSARSFGHDTAWLALSSEDTDRVTETLGLTNVQYVNWRTGLTAIADKELGEHFVFVTPPVAGASVSRSRCRPR